ncbi:DNA polymerase [Gammaproteobacteria bacterium]|nr:DNA polymerase [Gammaproteobacteria bacterium]
MSRIRKYFTSRWETGYIAEYDFSQLEVIALAHVSQDENLIADLKSGVDMHCQSASFLYNVDYSDIYKAYKAGDDTWTKRRKISKAPGFLIQYGGAANAMARATGLSVGQCQGFIENYYKRYTGVKAFQDSVMAEVKKSREMKGSSRTASGLPSGTGVYVSQTGRRYSFKEFDGFHNDTSFSPTQMKNYPVQGFATGDIVPMILGKLYRVLKNDSRLCHNCLLINTVHDSVVFDIKDLGTLDYADKVITTVMQNAPRYLKEAFDIDFDLELPVDGEAGKDWLNMKPINEVLIPF